MMGSLLAFVVLFSFSMIAVVLAFRLINSRRRRRAFNARLDQIFSSQRTAVKLLLIFCLSTWSAGDIYQLRVVDRWLRQKYADARAAMPAQRAASRFQKMTSRKGHRRAA